MEMIGYTDPLHRGFFKHSGVEGRYLAIDPDRFGTKETIDSLNDRFESESAKLAVQAATACLEQAGREPGEIDFVATTTCTGRLCPSLDARLIRDLGMKKEVQRVHVGDTGCASAIVAMQQAFNHLQAFPDHRALVIPVEVCSAAYYIDDDPETAVANAIFADGAAAVLLECGRTGIEIVSHRSRIEPEFLGKMGFTFPGGRPRILLSKEIRHLAARMIRDLSLEILEAHRIQKEEIRFWVLHSAGRRVLERASDLLNFQDHELRFHRLVLKKFGNISSATVFFVLQEVIRSEEPRPGDLGIMMALGPGFAAEGILLRW